MNFTMVTIAHVYESPTPAALNTSHIASTTWINTLHETQNASQLKYLLRAMW